ncbi:MAG: TerC family protein [Pseudomonadota bacterium]
MNEITTIGSPLLWTGFIIFVLIMLALDLFVFGANNVHKVSVKEAASWSLVWFLLAIGFNTGLWWYMEGSLGSEIADRKALEFFTGYLIEKSLSVDNVFIFLLIFSAFQVPAEYQRRVLVYGVLGAITMRILLILLGSWVVQEFHWVLYVFGIFLLMTGIKMMIPSDKKQNIEHNWVVKLARKYLRISREYNGKRFILHKDGVRYFTPLFLVLILIEASDLIFAVDSIPAIFAITTDPFIVATSNIFAIMGLRALYFLLADIAERFHLLKYGLAIVLSFIGTKMLVMPWYHMPVAISLTVVVVVIGLSIAASLWATRNERV